MYVADIIKYYEHSKYPTQFLLFWLIAYNILVDILSIVMQLLYNCLMTIVVYIIITDFTLIYCEIIILLHAYFGFTLHALGHVLLVPNKYYQFCEYLYLAHPNVSDSSTMKILYSHGTHASKLLKG